MKEYRLPVLGWWIQIAVMGFAIFLSIILIVIANIPGVFVINRYFYYGTIIIFLLFAIVGIYFLWNNWPLRIVITEINIVKFYVKSGIISMPITDLYAIRFGRGIWLYHAKGKFVFSLTPTNTAIWEFINEIYLRNPKFIIKS